jgi:exopolysaccharide production protein ExoZ
MLFNLHLLRALAALAVVYCHITSDAGLNRSVNIGAYGVDLFFVISGFIISYIGARSPDGFFVRRLIRIVPFYWVATLFVFVVAAQWPYLMRTTRADWVQLLFSLVFIPRETAYAGMFPTLILGWSLNYEMYFYVLFALSLLVTRRRTPLLCAALIAATVLIVTLSGTTNPSLLFYSRPLVFEFCFGIGCFYLLEIAERRIHQLQTVTGARTTLMLCATLAFLLLGLAEYHARDGWPRFITGGVPASMLVLSVLLLERIYGLAAKSRAVFLLGESSYILYLIHPYIIYTILRLVIPGARNLSGPVVAALIAALMAISASAAVAIHIWFEKPLLSFLRARLLRHRTGKPLTAQTEPGSLR